MPSAVAVDTGGAVYAAADGTVLKAGAGSSVVTALPLSSNDGFGSIAVDSRGTVYALEYPKRVLALPAGATSAVQLPFQGLQDPNGLAVDASGAVYDADGTSNRVLKLHRS
jgi:serine/threonine-protein kinase